MSNLPSEASWDACIPWELGSLNTIPGYVPIHAAYSSTDSRGPRAARAAASSVLPPSLLAVSVGAERCDSASCRLTSARCIMDQHVATAGWAQIVR